MSKSKIITIFIIVEAVLYLWFLAIDIITVNDSTAVKYASVILCFLASTSYLAYDKKIDKRLLINAALLLTVIADLFLLVLNDYYAAGVAVFAAAQTAYAAYLHFDKNGIAATVILRSVLIIGGVLFAYLWLGFSWLALLGIFYFVNLIVNVIESYVFIPKTGVTLAVGLTLLAFCDICVGLNNFHALTGILLPRWVNGFVAVAMWAFYLPSQVTIALNPMEEKIRV